MRSTFMMFDVILRVRSIFELNLVPGRVPEVTENDRVSRVA